ncbi:alpha/beta hydrolase [Geodermatophilaceae bacterium NBWT11]|nr:alpha/beta hydrolase [Geodermatophilaceae bacterium NBWT11]
MADARSSSRVAAFWRSRNEPDEGGSAAVMGAGYEFPVSRGVGTSGGTGAASRLPHCGDRYPLEEPTVPLDDPTTALLAQLAQLGAPPLASQTPEQMRAAAQGAGLSPTAPPMHRVHDLQVPTDDGATVPVRLLVPVEHPDGLLVYLHGGGWVFGGIEGFEQVGRELAARTGLAVAVVAYRLAPEFPHPTPLADAWSAVSWLSEQAAGLLGVDGPLVVAGDSAGATLATVVARRAAATDGPRIAAQVLVYPAVDHAMDTNSYLDPQNQLLVDAAAMAVLWDHYVPDHVERSHPDVSPLRADDLGGLPPTILATAEFDVLRDEGEAYADRLAEAGVTVLRRRFEGQMHGFFTLVDLLPASPQALDWIATGLRDLLDLPPVAPIGDPRD